MFRNSCLFKHLLLALVPGLVIAVPVITAFIKDYIQAPSMDKGLCRIGCFIEFGEMPKLSTKPSADELNALVAWLYKKF